MAPGCFSGWWCFRRLPTSCDDETVLPVSTRTTQPSNGDVRDAAPTEMARPCSPPGPGNADVPVPAPAQDSLPGNTAALSPTLTKGVPTGPHPAEGNVDKEVSSAPPSSRPAYRLNPVKAKEHIDRIPRFRILVMGRANAGKTTILQRVCNTTDRPEIFDGEGRKVDATKVQGSLTRGLHNIEAELVFRSNPRFVFHDSRGFEAGSEEQFDTMKKFVADRAETTELDKRIHAIWFCIPLTESHRLVLAAEKKFFEECDTGHVPVIVLLTKADTLTLDAVQELMSKGLNVDDAMKSAGDVEKGILDNCVLRVKDWLKQLKFPPHDYLSLSGMEQEGAECTPLLTCTANALEEEGLQQLLISTQQSNLELCMRFAIMKTLKRCMKEQVGKIRPAPLAFILSKWFPFVRKGVIAPMKC
ncbi:hypothetical protein EV401DRAFT_297308 [Pisolithus croceorrhizus]|nr:hypothetical protein EV401DRAFT_297308 [Pisolithus croceorrhizus]